MKGHIHKQGSNSWRLKFELGVDPATGKRQTHYSTFRGTKRDAQIEIVRLMGLADSGQYVSPDKVTVSEFLDRWERDWAKLNVSPKTNERYTELLKNHVRPHIGAMLLQKLKPVHLSELYAKLAREGRGTGDDGAGIGLAKRTVGHVHRVLHRAFVHAVQWQIIQQNPADHAPPPKVETAEIEILSADQMRAVLQALNGRALFPVVSFALATGMRRGEILALRWKDVDLSRDAGARVQVEQSLEQTKEGLRFKEPKTKKGRRAIALPPSAATELRGMRLAQQQLRLALGLGKLLEDALVFANADGTTRSPNGLTKDWTRTRDALKLPPVTFHAFRHTHASQLIASGMDVLSISRRLGHASPMVTLNIYGHLFGSNDDRAAQVMEAALARSSD